MTSATVPALAQVMSWADPAIQLSPPLGLVTVIEGRGRIEKTASLVSPGMPSVESLTLTRHWEETMAGTVQGKLPALDVPEVIDCQVLPLFVESSIFTVG